jgi:hypothetical protein
MLVALAEPPERDLDQEAAAPAIRRELLGARSSPPARDAGLRRLQTRGSRGPSHSSSR